MRKYKCFNCGAVIDHFLYRYDSAPNGDDEAVCPKCRRDDGFEEVKEEERPTGHWIYIPRTTEWQCSVCGGISYVDFPECPTCNADMKGE